MANLVWTSGAMSAGKSAALLSAAHNYDRIGVKSKTFTSVLENRYGVGVVMSRMGICRPAEQYTTETVFSVDSLEVGVRCLFVDEGQFLTKVQVRQLSQLAALSDVRVAVYGIRTDFRGNGFPGSEALGVMADEIYTLETLCGCGGKATFNVRLDANGNHLKDGEQIQIGDHEYAQVCNKCFYSDVDPV